MRALLATSWLDDASKRCSRSCRTTRCAQAGRRSCARRWRTSSPAASSRRSWPNAAPSTSACCKGRVLVALHMHAGDGNVHTNIPVNSDNYEMLQTAHAGGRAHHGAGAQPRRRDFGRARHRHHQARVPERRRDCSPSRTTSAGSIPKGGSTRASCLRDNAHFAQDGRSLPADLTNAYTPSFGLMGHESIIMQQSDIGAIADSVKDCLRCGKCKPVCATHVPRANLLYSPRNKILATSLLVEAFLYEEQTRRGVSIKHWEEFEDVADHCTVCHKCLTPCPVKIDFGDVSMNMRNLLAQDGPEVLPARQCGRDVLPQCHQSADHQDRCARAWSTSVSRRSDSPTTCCVAWRRSRRPRRRPRWARRRSRNR